MNRNEILGAIEQRIEEGIRKLRKIGKCAKRGDRVQPYDLQDLKEIVESLRHNTEQLNASDPRTRHDWS